DSRHAALSLPILENAVCAHLADAVDSQNAQWLFRQNFQCVQSTRRYQPFRVRRSDPLDQTGAEIFLDAFDSRGVDLLPMINLKLQSIARMALPGAGNFDFFAFRNRKDRADYGNSWTAVVVQTRHGVVRLRMLI